MYGEKQFFEKQTTYRDMKNLTIHNPEFIECLNGFHRRMKDQGRKPNSCEALMNNVRELLHYMENNQVDSLKKITQQKVDQYFKHLSIRPNQRRVGLLSTAYINKHSEAVLRFIEYLEGVNIGQSRIFIRNLKSDTKERTVLSEEEVSLMFNSQDNSLVGLTNKAILALLYGCGLRRSELYNLEMNDLDMVRGVIRLERTKTKHHREVPMSSIVQHHLEQYLYNAREIMLPPGAPETHLLVTYRGRRMSIMTISYRVASLGEVAGIVKKVTPHMLRHSIATHLLGELTLSEVAEFLGHRHLDSTQIYTHLKETLK